MNFKHGFKVNENTRSRREIHVFQSKRNLNNLNEGGVYLSKNQGGKALKLPQCKALRKRHSA